MTDSDSRRVEHDPDDEWLTPKEVMHETRFGRDKIYTELRIGALESVQDGPGGHYRIQRRDMKAWLTRMRRTASAGAQKAS
jgi:excisionase family DNA binding protein